MKEELKIYASNQQPLETSNHDAYLNEINEIEALIVRDRLAYGTLKCRLSFSKVHLT